MVSVEEKLKRRIEGQMRKMNGASLGPDGSKPTDSNAAAAAKPAGWAALTDDNKTTRQLASSHFRGGKPADPPKGKPAPKSKAKHWDEDDDE